MTTKKNKSSSLRVEEEWGDWNSVERDRARAFAERSPQDRLAWLEDILKLKAAAKESLERRQ